MADVSSLIIASIKVRPYFDQFFEDLLSSFLEIKILKLLVSWLSVLWLIWCDWYHIDHFLVPDDNDRSLLSIFCRWFLTNSLAYKSWSSPRLISTNVQLELELFNDWYSIDWFWNQWLWSLKSNVSSLNFLTEINISGLRFADSVIKSRPFDQVDRTDYLIFDYDPMRLIHWLTIFSLFISHFRHWISQLSFPWLCNKKLRDWLQKLITDFDNTTKSHLDHLLRVLRDHYFSTLDRSCW